MSRSLVGDLQLAVTEACTNVVRHAYDGTPGPMEVAVSPDDGALEVVVSDRGRGMGSSGDMAGPHFGLPLMSALSRSIEIEERPGAGRRISMSFPLRPEAERSGRATHDA